MSLSKYKDHLPEYINNYIELRIEYGPKAIGALLAVYTVFKVGNQLITSRMLRKKREKVQKLLREKKQIWRTRALSQIDEKECETIIKMPFNDLVSALQKGELKAVTVLRAFQRQAASEDEKYNFVTEPLDPESTERLAEELDGIPVSERSSKPLFGIPLSVKENEDFAGHMICMGLSNKLDFIAEKDSPRVKVLRDLGAVPFIRTNVPQALLSFSCSNPVYGECRNPWDVSREPGGSSGGEGAAIACGASVFGLGSDIGGSLRIPGAWCGIPAMKPTAGRLSHKGRMASNPGQRVVQATAGPMSSSVEGLIMMTRAFSSTQMFYEDPTIPHIPLDESELSSTQRMTIGMFECDGEVEVCESAKRAVRETAKLLTDRGHKIVPYKLRDMTQTFSHYFPAAVFGDGGKAMCDLFYGDKISEDNRPMYNLLRLPLPIKYLVNKLASLLMPKYASDVIKCNMGVASVRDWFLLTAEVEKYRYNVIEDWREAGLDAVLCPAMPIPAMYLGKPAYAKCAVAYMVPWNVLNFPCGVVPVTKVTSADLHKDQSSFPAKDIFHKTMKQSLEGSEGLPMAIQLVTLPNYDERCLRLMKEVETHTTPLVRK